MLWSMEDLTGKAAFVTGGASGIGRALARRLVAAGMRVMVADVEAEPLHVVVADLKDGGADVRGVECDVTSYESVERAANAAIDAFGKVHVVCNNAGVSSSSGTDAISLQEWRWVIDVNLMGVVHGVRALVPHIKSHGEAGHVVNTASMAGFLPAVGFGAYTASKYAVVGLSEALAVELAPHGIGVSVLCPGGVPTRIAESRRNWPTTYGQPPQSRLGPQTQQSFRTGEGVEPDEVANQVLLAIRTNDLYVFTHPSWRPAVEDRFARVLTAYPKHERAPQTSRS
jgi:NAD(P)-dependent dehydrogenase (short-subunit alcohol dehydrogenase family)